MLTTSRKSLSLSGGHLIEQTFPSYSPNAQFPWEEDVDVINTPDIDPSFFTDDPFKKMNNNQMDYMSENLMIGHQNCINDETCENSTQQSLEDNVFIDLSQLISQSTEPVINQSMVSPNEVLDNSYIPSTTAPVLHYLQSNDVIESMVSSVSIPVITTNIISNESTLESIPLSQSLTSSPHPSQSISPPMTTSPSYITPSSPALSYTSTTSHSYYVPSEEAMNTDSNTIDSMIETKPELTFLQPTVINDHLYTLPSTSSSRSKRKSSTDSSKTDNKYTTTRKKNNAASKKSRITKRDKQKQMEEKIAFYVEDNQKCSQMIAKMEKEIEWCKNYLFKKVVAASKS